MNDAQDPKSTLAREVMQELKKYFKSLRGISIPYSDAVQIFQLRMPKLIDRQTKDGELPSKDEMVGYLKIAIHHGLESGQLQEMYKQIVIRVKECEEEKKSGSDQSPKPGSEVAGGGLSHSSGK